MNFLKNSISVIALFSAMGLITFTSCGDDDGPDGPVSSDFYVPSSIVDGVRVASNSQVNATYNSDGSIDKVIFEGDTYKFEYTESRATYTGRKLARIVFEDPDTECECTDIQFNEDGFLTNVRIHRASDYEGDGFDEDVNLGFSYDGSGHVKATKVKGKTSERIDGEKETVNFDYTIKYDWSNNNLTKSSVSYQGHGIEMVSTPGKEDNTFNVMTPMEALCVVPMGDPISIIFGNLGYLGNASAKLPSRVTREYYPMDDEVDDDDFKYNITYTFNPDHSINTVTCTPDQDDWSVEIFRYTYYTQE